jgi:glutamate dehydrogenase (NADP+)
MERAIASLDELKRYLEARYPHMPEYQQAVRDVGEDIIEHLGTDRDEAGFRVLRYLTEPDRVISFRINWEDDHNRTRHNRGYRVQFSNALGPYKGGLRLHPRLNLSVLHFLAFEQTFKNSLTGLPMGGAKGGADFDPRDKSDAEIQRFCRAFMNQLARHIGPDIDVPAGDMGVGPREIAYLFDQYRTVSGKFSGVITGKDPVFGGSCFREEATGYGCVYFAECVLKQRDSALEGKRCLVSGAGNVALHTAEKLLEHDASVLSLSDREGTVHFKDGLNEEQLATVKQHKKTRGGLKSLAEEKGWSFREDCNPWTLDADLAFACATQNELDAEDARQLAGNGCEAVFEGANMPCTLDAVQTLRSAGVTLAPSKAVNAGGVAVSGLEISQNRTRLSWNGDRVNGELKSIMQDIHSACVEYGKSKNGIDYKKGANIAAFVELSKAIELYGLA